jgi:hypothetical protein
VAAGADELWAAVTDWPTQGEWMLATIVDRTSQAPDRVGSELAAWTGLGRPGRGLGFWDTMVIEQWLPPLRCRVRHTGSVVRGDGWFAVTGLAAADTGAEHSRFVWAEELDLPLGVLGVVGWWLVKPVMRHGVQLSLNRLARRLARP